MINIGFIGCGKIAEPMIRSLVRRFPQSSIAVSQRTEVISSRLQAELENVKVMDNQSILNQSEIVFLCLLAHVARQELPGLEFKENHVVISAMADISLKEISGMIAPASDPCVTVPLPFISAGGCPLPVFPDSPALQELFRDENEIIPVSKESAMGPHFAATAILSTVMKQLDTVSHWLVQYTDDKIGAEKYVATLVAGYLSAMPKDGQERFVEALKDLSTEGGLNAQLLKHNTDHDVFKTLQAGLEALGERVK